MFRKACKVERFKRLGRIIERAIGENVGFDALEDAKALAVFLVEAASRGISFECHTGCPLACTDFISSVDGMAQTEPIVNEPSQSSLSDISAINSIEAVPSILQVI